MMRRSPWAPGSTCARRRAGLHVTGRLDRNVQRARELFSLLETRGLDGLSIGFRTVKARRDKATASRLLTEIDLWEISLVTFPMLDGSAGFVCFNIRKGKCIMDGDLRPRSPSAT